MYVRDCVSKHKQEAKLSLG